MLRLRPYKKGDASEIVSWIEDEEGFRKWSAYRYDHYPITSDDMNKLYDKEADNDVFFAMSALDGDKLCGHLIMRFTDELKTDLRFGFIIVDPKVRGRGYGYKMISLALQYAFNVLKVERVTLCVYDNNESAKKCYYKCGFREYDESKRFKFNFHNQEWTGLELEAHRCEGVVFDMDGIIFDSEKLVLSSWQIIAAKYGIRNVEEACRRGLGLNAAATEVVFKEMYGEDFDYVGIKKEVSAIFHDEVAKGNLDKKQGIEELLIFLKENNIKLAVASSTRREVVERELRDAGLLKYFDVVIAGDMVNRSKPCPDIFLTACEELGVSVEKTFAIEDSFNGIRSASAAGMRPIMVPDMVEPDDEIKKLCYRVLSGHIQVLNFIKNWIW